MALLSAVGTATYNTITLNCLHNTRITATPIHDEARRTIVAWRHLLYVEAWIRVGDYAAGSTTDTDLDALKAKLLQPAGQLTFTSKGYGNVTVNVSGAKDVMWGPMPTVFEWVPIGNQGALIHWGLEWIAPVCNGTTRYTREIMAFNWDYQCVLDQQGLSTRTISGYAEIPMTRFSAGSKLLPDMSDEYREQVAKNFEPVPIGFKRQASYHVSKDKRRLDFTLTDTEIPSQNPLPEGVTDAPIHASLSTAARGKTGIFMEWYWRMHGSITVAPQMPTAFAWSKFLVYLNDRLRWLKNNQNLIPTDRAGQIILIPTRFEWGEEVNGLTSTFSVEYYIMSGAVQGSAGLASVLRASGLWKPIEGPDWLRWRNSMAALGVSTPRGSANLFLSAQHDAIVDLCVGDSAPKGPSYAITKQRGNVPTLPIINLNPCGIWLWYQNQLRVMSQPGNSFHWPLAPGQKAVQHVKYEGTRITLQMKGWALRFCQPTPIPELLTVNGKKVKQIGEAMVENHVVKFFGGWPIVRTEWEIYYLIDEPVDTPENIPIPPKVQEALPGNPIIGGQEKIEDQGMKQRQKIDPPKDIMDWDE